ncbi:hypothetical protein MMC22_005178 [Lobaria immixta]|nr:hypothetical protein [Lobaria immixta]
MPSSSDPKRSCVEDLRPQGVEVDDSPISDYESLPPPAQVWAAIGDTASALFLYSQLNIEQYRLAVRLFHARLGLIVRGLDPDQLLVISLVTNPDFASTANRSDKERLKYAEDYQYAKRKKNATKFPFPELPASAEAMLEITQPKDPLLAGLSFGKANVVDLWATEMAAVKTEKTPSGKLEWIADDNGNLWFHALKRVAFNLIRWYAIMAADVPEKDVSRMAAREALGIFSPFLWQI